MLDFRADCHHIEGLTVVISCITDPAPCNSADARQKPTDLDGPNKGHLNQQRLCVPLDKHLGGSKCGAECLRFLDKRELLRSACLARSKKNGYCIIYLTFSIGGSPGAVGGVLGYHSTWTLQLKIGEAASKVA